MPARLGGKLSAEHKRKLSEMAKLRTGSKNGFFGHTHTVSVKRRLSRIAKNRPPPYRKVIMIGDTQYESAAAAARVLGVCRSTITKRLRSGERPDYRYVS
jgi:DNA-directed RNA polymerase specialized sigma24 family protein